MEDSLQREKNNCQFERFFENNHNIKETVSPAFSEWEKKTFYTICFLVLILVWAFWKAHPEESVQEMIDEDSPLLYVLFTHYSWTLTHNDKLPEDCKECVKTMATELLDT